MGVKFKEVIQCVVILLKTSTKPKKEWFWLCSSVLQTLIKHPDSIFNRTTLDAKKHFLSDYLPHQIIVKSPQGIIFVARPNYEDFARFLFSKIVGKWEPLEVINPEKNEIIVDIGANVGYYSLLLASKIKKDGKIIAIEADSQTCQVLKKNCQLNNFSNIDIHNVAITEKNGTVKIFHSETHSGINTLFSNSESQENYSLIESTSLDNLLDNKYKKIDWIKIDVEGSELLVLKGAVNTLKITKNIIIEIHENILKENNQSPNEIIEILNKHGFKIKTFNEFWDPNTSVNQTLKSDYIYGKKD